MKKTQQLGSLRYTKLNDDIVDIADLSIIYLTYDEPQKEEFWLKIKNIVPWATRVDGVKGSDAAHKAAGQVSETERFIVIDGDNMPDEDFFNLQLDFRDKDPIYKKAQFRWKAVNHINGLRYGNGGISSWTKEYVANMKTHEAQTEGDVARIADFCLDGSDNLYWSMYNCYSTTYPNYTPFQAWRAGFREGVKMCLVNGKVPSIDQFKESVASRNLNNLTIWHNVGTDVENGIWAIYGARMGTLYTFFIDSWDYKDVQWFDYFPAMFDNIKDLNPVEQAEEIGYKLRDRLGLPICTLNAEQSKFFKRHYKSDIYNKDPLVKEIEIITKIEGW